MQQTRQFEWSNFSVFTQTELHTARSTLNLTFRDDKTEVCVDTGVSQLLLANMTLMKRRVELPTTYTSLKLQTWAGWLLVFIAITLTQHTPVELSIYSRLKEKIQKLKYFSNGRVRHFEIPRKGGAKITATTALRPATFIKHNHKWAVLTLQSQHWMLFLRRRW